MAAAAGGADVGGVRTSSAAAEWTAKLAALEEHLKGLEKRVRRAKKELYLRGDGTKARGQSSIQPTVVAAWSLLG